MEGSESEAIFESLNLKPQLFINEVLNSVDDLVDEAFTFFHQEASTMLKTEVNDRSNELSKGVAFVRNMVQSALDKRLTMWEKYCLQHCFVVPEGFSLPKADESSGDAFLDLDTLGDSELDVQLNSLRDKLTSVGQESDKLSREIQTLERQSELISHSAASMEEALQIYDKHSMHEMFQDFKRTESEFHAKVEKLKTGRMEEIEYARAKRMRITNGDTLKATRGIGHPDAKLEELQELFDDIKNA